MCTIGVVYRKSTLIIFKQYDSNEEILFNEPLIKEKNDIRYMSFEKQGVKGSWCGINNYGVGFTSSTPYISKSKNTMSGKFSNNNLFEAYENIISSYKTAKEAVEYIKGFFKSFLEPNILIVSDKDESYYIEGYNGEIIAVRYTPEFHSRYFVASNLFRFIKNAVSFEENHSTYLRLNRAEDMLLRDCSINGVIELLKDQYYGNSVMSICRSNEVCLEKEEKSYTQASVIFIVNNNSKDISTYYNINGNPRDKGYIFKNYIFN